MNSTLEKLIKSGIPVSKAQFHEAVNNSDQTPEHFFASDSNVKSRNVTMWYTPHTLICLHKDKYFGVPNATIKFVNFAHLEE